MYFKFHQPLRWLSRSTKTRTAVVLGSLHSFGCLVACNHLVPFGVERSHQCVVDILAPAPGSHRIWCVSSVASLGIKCPFDHSAVLPRYLAA